MKQRFPMMMLAFLLLSSTLMIPLLPAQSALHNEGTRAVDPVDYLIITNDTYVATFQELADYRKSQGHVVKIETVSNITAQSTGRDTPEKIRNYLRTMHQAGLRFVLLGGKYEDIPPRYAYLADIDTDTPGPTDFYYSSLNESWDSDDDSNFAEYYDGDTDISKWQPNINFSFDLAVGRAPVNDVSDISLFINKIKAFEQRASVDIAHMLLVGEYIEGAAPGDTLSDGARGLEDDIPPVLPLGYNISRIYAPEVVEVSPPTLDILNKDTPQIIVNLGHGATWLILSDDPKNIANSLDENASAEPFVWFSLSCGVAEISPKNTSPRYTGELLVMAPRGPAAFMGNTQFGRLGYEEYDAMILEEIYSDDVDILGEAILNAKQRVFERFAYDPWAEFAMIPAYLTVHTLLGDPALRMPKYEFPRPVLEFVGPEAGLNLSGGSTIDVMWTTENLTEESEMYLSYVTSSYITTTIEVDPLAGQYVVELPSDISTTQFSARVVNTTRQRLEATYKSPTFQLDTQPPSIYNFNYSYEGGYLRINFTSAYELLNTSSVLEGAIVVDGTNYSWFELLSVEEVSAGFYFNDYAYSLRSLAQVDEAHNCTVYLLGSIKDTSYPGHCLAEPASYYVQGNTSSMDDTSIPQFLGQSAVKDSDSIGFQLILSNDDGVSSVNFVYRNKSTNNWVYILMTKSDNYKCSISCLNNSYIDYFYLIEYDDKMLTIMEDEEKPFEIIFTPSGLIPTEDFNVIDDSIPLNRLPFGFLMAAVGIILIIVACVLAAKDRSKRPHWNQTRKNKK